MAYEISKLSNIDETKSQVKNTLINIFNKSQNDEIKSLNAYFIEKYESHLKKPK